MYKYTVTTKSNALKILFKLNYRRVMYLKYLILQKKWSLWLTYYHIFYYEIVNTDTTLCKQHFVVAAARGRTTFNYFILNIVVPKLGVRPLQWTEEKSEETWDG